jgi:hypothetical protein
MLTQCVVRLAGWLAGCRDGWWLQAVVDGDDADAAVGNITGSNSVNVFLGLGCVSQEPEPPTPLHSILFPGATHGVRGRCSHHPTAMPCTFVRCCDATQAAMGHRGDLLHNRGSEVLRARWKVSETDYMSSQPASQPAGALVTAVGAL